MSVPDVASLVGIARIVVGLALIGVFVWWSARRRHARTTTSTPTHASHRPRSHRGRR